LNLPNRDIRVFSEKALRRPATIQAVFTHVIGNSQQNNFGRAYGSAMVQNGRHFNGAQSSSIHFLYLLNKNDAERSVKTQPQ